MEGIIVRPRERDAIINSLRAGVVPRIGQSLFQVGRVEEVKTLLRDIETVADKGAALRLVIGDFGAGKTFFLQLVQAIALEKKLVMISADLSPDRRLYASAGQAQGLYRDLMTHVATRTKPEGGALEAVVERFANSAKEEAEKKGVPADTVMRERLASLQDMVCGYDFASVILAYWEGWESGRDEQKTAAIRWLRGEFTTKTDARAALNVRTIVEDSNVYDFIKVFGRFVTLAGYSGLYVMLDEMVNLYKLSNTESRTKNYEQLLRMVNDTFQGNVSGLGFLLAGTPDFLMDTRKGLYSYQALQTRLAENSMAKVGETDFTGPVIRLASLTLEDLYLLLKKLRHVYALGAPKDYLIDDSGIKAYLEHCNKKIGAATYRTPRSAIKGYLDLLAMLQQDRSKSWADYVSSVSIKPDKEPDDDPESASPDGGLVGFKL